MSQKRLISKESAGESFWARHKDKIQGAGIIASIVTNLVLTSINCWFVSHQISMTEEYYKPALQLQRESLSKKAELVVLVDPTTDFLYRASVRGNWSIETRSLIVHPQEPFVFRLFVCNIGNRPALLEYLFAYCNIIDGKNKSAVSTFACPIGGKVLRPFETFEYNYTLLVMPEGSESTWTWPGSGFISFAVMTTEELKVSETIRFSVRYYPHWPPS